MKCNMLDQFGIWGVAELDTNDFKKVCDYGDEEGEGIEIWKGSNKDYFILKNVRRKK